MNRILLIIQREVKAKIKKKAFWVMALLGPLLFAVGMIVPLWTGMQKQEKRIIEVVDRSGLIDNKIISTTDLVFVYSNDTNNFQQSSNDFYAILIIPQNVLEHPSDISLYSKSKTAADIKWYIEKNLTEILFTEKLKRSGIDNSIIEKSYSPITITNKKFDHDWEKNQKSSASLVAGFFLGILIMFFIVLYGGQVMRGVMEEKMNRIVEVIISSVKPFELMMGKIIGIAIVSLAQFLIWLTMTYSISFLIQSRYGKVFESFSDQQIEQTLKNNPQIDAMQAMEINQMVSAFNSIDIAYLLGLFFIYFILGYLLYAALFAGIGSAVDSETDTQQFVFPLIAPLMLVILMATTITSNPHGNLAFWLSMIPFTSPVAMMLRLPYDVPVIQIIISILLLFISFILFTWLSSRIYRVGILMYGKKVTFRELGKWMMKK